MEELFKRYYYLVKKYAKLYGLDEDSEQELAIHLWDACKRHTDKTFSTAYMRLNRTVTYWAQKIAKAPKQDDYLCDITFVVYPSADVCIEASVANASISVVLKELTPREEYVIIHRFGLNGVGEHLREEIAEDLQVSAKRVQEIEMKALRKLRHYKRRRQLRGYFDVG